MNTTLLDACRLKKTAYTPIWIMRQAGRYLPEYRATKDRAGDFLTLCRTPELAAEVTIQPVDLIGVDAAILFSDILVVPEAMGIPYHMEKGEGPVLERPQKPLWEALTVPDVEDRLSYVLEAIKLTKRELAGRVPLLGFSGAPFTLATYIIEGGSSRDFRLTKKFMFEEPARFAAILDLIAQTVTRYLKAKIAAGVDAVQLFDTWAPILSKQDYDRFAKPATAKIIAGLRGCGAPVIHYMNGVSHLYDSVLELGADVIGIDWRMDLKDAKRRSSGKHAIQGNLDPYCLYLPEPELKRRVQELLDQWGQDPGHIFNLGHGIFPEADVQKTKALVAMVHELSRRG